MINIYRVLLYFEKLYGVMDELEKQQIMESLISKIQVYEERKENGQWLKSIKFKLPIIEEDMELSLDNDAYVEPGFYSAIRLYLKNCHSPGQSEARNGERLEQRQTNRQKLNCKGGCSGDLL